MDTQKLEQVVEVINQKIDKRFDDLEIEAKKSTFNQNKNRINWLQKGLEENKGNSGAYEIKGVGDLFTSNATGEIVPPAYVRGFKYAPFESNLAAVFPQSSTDSDKVIVNRSVITNNAAEVAEGAAKPKSTEALTAVTFDIKKFAHHFVASTEFLEDVDGASQYISAQLQGGLFNVLNNDLISDLDANNTAWAAGDFADAVDNANELDCLFVGINQLKLANYNPSAIMLNPTDATKIALLKNSNNSYLRENIYSGLQPQLDGINIITNPSVDAGDFYISDLQAYGAYYVRQGLGVQVGTSGSDFVNNTRTVLGETRGVLAIYDTGALISGVFSTAKAALETP